MVIGRKKYRIENMLIEFVIKAPINGLPIDVAFMSFVSAFPMAELVGFNSLLPLCRVRIDLQYMDRVHRWFKANATACVQNDDCSGRLLFDMEFKTGDIALYDNDDRLTWVRVVDGGQGWVDVVANEELPTYRYTAVPSGRVFRKTSVSTGQLILKRRKK